MTSFRILGPSSRRTVYRVACWVGLSAIEPDPILNSERRCGSLHDTWDLHVLFWDEAAPRAANHHTHEQVEVQDWFEAAGDTWSVHDVGRSRDIQTAQLRWQLTSTSLSDGMAGVFRGFGETSASEHIA